MPRIKKTSNEAIQALFIKLEKNTAESKLNFHQLLELGFNTKLNID
jgi:hypothetical protein